MRYVKIAVVAVVCLLVFGGYFFYLNHRSSGLSEGDVEVTAVQEVISKQLDTAYPPTPREVIKFYNRILECMYGEKYTQKQFDQMADQARKLMDDELIAGNPEQEYKKQLQEEVTEYKEDSQKIIQTTVCDSDEVEYVKLEGKECAYVESSYFMRKGKGKFMRTYERYLLRKADDGKWKILAYYLMQGNEES